MRGRGEEERGSRNEEEGKRIHPKCIITNSRRARQPHGFFSLPSSSPSPGYFSVCQLSSFEDPNWATGSFIRSEKKNGQPERERERASFRSNQFLGGKLSNVRTINVVSRVFLIPLIGPNFSNIDGWKFDKVSTN